MAIHTFDSLLSSLSSSVREAQKSLSRHHQGELRRLYTDGSGKSLTWSFYIPSDKEDDENYRPVELPLISLRSQRELNISELSITLACGIEEADVRDIDHLPAEECSSDDTQASESSTEAVRGGPLMLVLKSFGTAVSGKLAKIKILLNANRSQGSVLVNDQALKKFEIHDRSGALRRGNR